MPVKKKAFDPAALNQSANLPFLLRRPATGHLHLDGQQQYHRRWADRCGLGSSYRGLDGRLRLSASGAVDGSAAEPSATRSILPNLIASPLHYPAHFLM